MYLQKHLVRARIHGVAPRHRFCFILLHVYCQRDYHARLRSVGGGGEHPMTGNTTRRILVSPGAAVDAAPKSSPSRYYVRVHLLSACVCCFAMCECVCTCVCVYVCVCVSARTRTRRSNRLLHSPCRLTDVTP